MIVEVVLECKHFLLTLGTLTPDTDVMVDEGVLDVIIVDDEPAILEGLEKTYDWKGFGFRVVGTARSGEKALSLVREVGPDVVMTDIRMKKMDGLELIERCQQFNPTLEFVIISAHDDFTYAQRACALGVFSYLLKPVDDAQFQEVMTKIHSRCEYARNQVQRIDQYHRLVVERKYEFEERLFRKFLTQSIDVSELVGQLELIASDIHDTSQFCSICLDINTSDRILVKVDIDAHRFVMIRAVIEQVSKHYPVWSFELSDGRVIIVVKDQRTNRDSDTILSGLIRKSLRKAVPGRIPCLVTAIGGFRDGFSGLAQSYEHALGSFEYNVAVGTGGDPSIGGKFHEPVASIKYPHEEALQIIRSIRLSDNDLMIRYLKEFGLSIADTDRDGRCLSFQRLCNEIGFYLLEAARLADKPAGRLRRYTEHIFKLSSEEMSPVLEEILEGIIALRGEDQLSRTAGRYDSRISDVLLYIDLHLKNERLSVHDCADHVFLNVAYFGRLFRKITGVSFGEYTARKRVERASALLNSTDMTIQQISEDVGIPNSSYFSTVFRKYSGISPSEYRKNA